VTAPPDPLEGSTITLRGIEEDGVPMMCLELLNEDNEVFAFFNMNFQTAEAVCITLALWSRSHAPGQTAPTSTTIM
jgi:hypothetical protein